MGFVTLLQNLAQGLGLVSGARPGVTEPQGQPLLHTLNVI